MRLSVRVMIFLCLSCVSTPAFSARETIRLYIDADSDGAVSSTRSIAMGIRTAIGDDGIGGRPVEIIIKNHQGNSLRSRENIESYLADEQALAMYGGLHSPPLLANREFINANKALMLVPWAAAGPITRHPSSDNWIFRLSVDDTKAGKVLVDYAIKTRGFKKPALLLEETGWGKSNEETMQAALGTLGIPPAQVFWFNWGVNESAARILLRNIAGSGADVIIFVANAPEAKTFVRAAVSLSAETRRAMVSHWGLTGGDFPEVIGEDMREQMDLVFLQTSFSFVGCKEGSLGSRVFKQASRLFPDEIVSPEDLKAPAGFIHAYDLTLLLIDAVNKVDLGDDMLENRKQVRRSLEHLDDPVVGLVKTYRRPFGRFAGSNPDAHEALSQDDLVMARYGEQGEILLLAPDR